MKKGIDKILQDTENSLNSIFPELLTGRPEGMSMEEYKKKLKDQKAMLKYYKKHGRAETVRRLRNIKG